MTDYDQIARELHPDAIERQSLSESIALRDRIAAALRAAHEAGVAAEKERMNTPEINDFAAGVVREAQHQRARWGIDHDAGKTPEDWLWLVAFLVTKATQAARSGDPEKHRHHIITAAAALANWHAQASGDSCNMRPGIGPGNKVFEAIRKGG